MGEIIILKVGICACTPLFHGQFAGHTFQVGSREFVLEEVVIPEDGVRRQIITLINRECQIFLDVHGHTIFLDLYQVIPVRNEYLLVNGLGTKTIHWDQTNENSLTTDHVLDTLRTQIECLMEEQVEKWLSSWSEMAKHLALTTKGG